MYVCMYVKDLIFNAWLFFGQVPDIRDEEALDSESVASVLHWQPQGSAGEGSTASSSRKPISALSPQVRT